MSAELIAMARRRISLVFRLNVALALVLVSPERDDDGRGLGVRSIGGHR